MSDTRGRSRIRPRRVPSGVWERAGLLGATMLALVLHLLVLYWPIVTVSGPVEWTDKVVHLAVFAVPTYLLGLCWRPLPAVILLAVHAPVSELAQHWFLPGRTGDVWDGVLDLVGVAAGALALLATRRATRRALVD